MNLLLDTHTLIWFCEDDEKLSLEAKKEIENPGNTPFISIASLWEMAIKISLKKLELAIPLKKLVELLNENSIEKIKASILFNPINFNSLKNIKIIIILISYEFILQVVL